MKGIGTLRERLVVPRRTAVLADALSRALFDVQTALDVGCGEGSIDLLIQAALPGLAIRGVDVLVWPEARIPVETFDGYQLPFDDKSFDTVMFVDVLHHTDDPMVLLREAKRVARRAIVLKDHTADGALRLPNSGLVSSNGRARWGSIPGRPLWYSNVACIS